MVYHGNIYIHVSCMFHPGEVSRHADCSLLLLRMGFGLGLFSRSDTTYVLYVIGRSRQAWFEV